MNTYTHCFSKYLHSLILWLGAVMLVQLVAYTDIRAQVPDTSIAFQYMDQAYDLITDSFAYREALPYIREARSIFEQVLGPLDTMVAETYLYEGECYFYLEDHKSAIALYEKEGAIYRQLDNILPTRLANNYNNLGMSYEAYGNYEEALRLYEQSIEIHLTKGDHNSLRNLPSVYNNLAICYSRRTGNYHKANQYFQKTLQSELAYYGKENLSIAGTYSNIGINFYQMGDHEKSLAYLFKALDIRQRLQDKDKYRMGRLYGSIAVTYFDMNNYEKALEYSQKEQQIRLSISDSEDNTYAHIMTGKCYREMGDFDAARTNLQKALAIQKKEYRPFHYSINDIEMDMVLLELAENKTIAAKQRIDSLLVGFRGGHDPRAFTELQKPLHYLSLLTTKGEAYEQLYAETQDTQVLHQLLTNYSISIDLIDYIRINLDEEASKQIIVRKNYAVFGRTIDVLYKLWQSTQDAAYIEQAFEIIEKGKSVVLLDAVHTAYAQDFAGIPPPLLQQERQLKREIAAVEKERYELNPTETTAKVALNNRLFDLKVTHEKLIKQFETDYPTYFDLKYGKNYLPLATVQTHLLDNETSMVNYFLTANALYSLVINPTEVFFVKTEIPDTTLEQSIKNFITSISDYVVVPSEQRSTLEERYITEAVALYRHLVKPIEKQLLPKVIWVPHNLLGYIPFECLLKNNPTESYAFRSHPYLLHDYQMSYTFSANMLYQMKQARSMTAPKQFVGFAPVFPDPKNTTNDRLAALGQLTMNVPEVQMIQEIMQGDVYLQQAATEATFIENAQDYQVIHLATHGIANDQSGDFCYLAFSEIPDSIENEILYTKELYPLQLHADMVVLSACETATGELKKGEGLVSLARGFSYAGAKSIITTLWSINDATSAQLMQYFYTDIQKGLTKDAALRNAQQTYLQQSRDQEAHPVYWAAFIPVGNMTALSQQGSNRWWIGLVLVMVGWIGWRWIRKHRSTTPI